METKKQKKGGGMGTIHNAGEEEREERWRQEKRKG